MPKVVVSGALANKPFNGGNAWSRLSWILGFQKLGFEVVFVEEIKSSACRDGEGRATTVRNSVNLRYFRSVMERFGLSKTCALICDEGQEVYGMPWAELSTTAREAVFLFNLSGHLSDERLKSAFQCKVYYDDDPGFTQFWQASGVGGARLEEHDFYFTIGSNMGAQDCLIPIVGIQWRHTRPPVVLEQWPFCPAREWDRFTTVASWRGSYGPVQYGGRNYGLKVHEFRKFMSLPRRAGYPFEIALQIEPGDARDLQDLHSHGWQIADPKAVAGTPESFRTYVQESGAEFSVAQGLYVETNSGWFSDRTVKYLASGRPALVQDTGFSKELPVGDGLLGFRTLAEALEGANRIHADYKAHSQAARQVAEEYFDSDKLIGRLLTELNLRSPRKPSAKSSAGPAQVNALPRKPTAIEAPPGLKLRPATAALKRPRRSKRLNLLPEPLTLFPETGA